MSAPDEPRPGSVARPGRAMRRYRLAMLPVLAVLAAVPWLAGGRAGSAAEGSSQPSIEIYTSASCGYCRTLKRYLAARDLEYVEHNINATVATREAFYAMGGRGTPLVVIGGQRIHGFNPLRIEAALEAAREAARPGAEISAGE